MLSLLGDEIDPIGPVLNEVHPNANTSQIGSWGILYIVCGSLAGQSFRWATTVFESIPTSYSELFREWMSGERSEWDIAFGFKDLIFEWAQDPTTLAIARARLADLEQSRGKTVTDKSRQYFLDYGRLAIMLNGLSGVDTKKIVEIGSWLCAHNQSWMTMFFGAGILLGHERNFP